MASKTLNTILSLQDQTSSKLVKVSSNFKNLSKEAQKATLSAQRSLNNLGKGIEKTVTNAVKKVGQIGIAIGGLAGGLGLSEALNLEGYRVQLETATKSTEKAAEIMKYSIDLANKTPFEGGEMVEASAKLESMGLSAQSYLTNIVDMAAATNKPLDQATEAFIDAQTGELERLKEFGIKKADIQKKANEMFAGQETINNKGQIVNQENFNKALLAIMEDRYTGGAEKLANTTKGMLSTITGVTKSALAKIIGVQEDGTIKSGSLLEKIKGKVQVLADKLTQWQSDGTLDNIADKVTEVFGKVYSVISKTIDFIVQHKDIIITIGSMAVAFTLVSKAVRGVSVAIKAFQVVWAILNGTIMLSPIGWVIAGITALVGVFVLAYQKSETFRNAVQFLWNKILELGAGIIAWANETILPIIKSIGASLLEFWDSTLSPFLQWCLGVLAPVFGGVWDTICQFVSGAFDSIGEIIQGILEVFQGIIDFITGVFSGDWEKAWKGIKEIFSGIIDGIKGIWDGLVNLLSTPIHAAINITKHVFGGGEDASGTDVAENATGTNYFGGGYTWVGEHGPELMKLPSGTQIKTNSQLNNMVNSNSNIPPITVIIQGNVIGNEQFADYVGDHIVSKVKLALNNM